MSYASEGQLIREHVEATWVATDVQYPNISYDPTPGESWARLSILPLTAFRLCIGDPPTKRRHVSQAVFQVFVPPDKGDGDARVLVDTATAMLRDPGLSGLKFREPEVQYEGLDAFGWVGWTVSAAFERDEVI